MHERRKRGLCYYCDEKFHPGHRCNRPKIFLLEGMREGEGEERDEESEGALAVIQLDENKGEEEEVGELLGISLHALEGSLAPKAMRLRGTVNHQNVFVLIDTGST